MRVFNPAFTGHQESLQKEPFYVASVAFDAAGTDLVWITSDSRAAVPDTAATVLHGLLDEWSQAGQSLSPIEAISTIGNMSIDIVDYLGVFTQLMATKYAAGKTLRGKTVTVYGGYPGLGWDKYESLESQVMSDPLRIGAGNITLVCSDRQRSATDDEIFRLANTNLRLAIDESQVLIPAYAVSEFELLAHGSSYTDAPNKEVLYLHVDDELIRCVGSTTDGDLGLSFVVDSTVTSLSSVTSEGDVAVDLTDASLFRSSGSGTIRDVDLFYPFRWTGKSGNQLTGCTGIGVHLANVEVYDSTGRGVLNSRAVVHEVDDTSEPDRRPAIVEHVYLEMPVVKLAYAILTGILYGQAGKTLPSTWQKAISTLYVSTAQFISIGADIWDPTDDTKGVICLFSGGVEDEDALDFVNQELLRLAGCYMCVLHDGQLGLNRLANVKPHSAYVDVLDDSNVVKFSSLTLDYKQVYNRIKVSWNHDPILDDFTRSSLFVDLDSADPDKWGASPIFDTGFRGLHGARHTDTTLARVFDRLRDMYVGAPYITQVEVLSTKAKLATGDVIRLMCGELLDPQTGLAVDRAFLIVNRRVIPRSGRIVLSLFGSSEAATPMLHGSTSTVLPDAAYSSVGTNLQSVAGITTSLIGGVLHITGATTGLAGGESMNDPASIYYSLYPTELDSGVVCPFTDNVQLRVMGHKQINGTYDGAGRGLPGGLSQGVYYGDLLPVNEGHPGGIGNTKAGGGFIHYYRPMWDVIFSTTNASVIEGKYESMPEFSLEIDGNNIDGLPDDLRGTSGSEGESVFIPGLKQVISGGKGGNGGAAMIIISRGLDIGVSGEVDSSGVDGNLGIPRDYFSVNIYSGTGAAGHAGGQLYIMDGSFPVPDLSGNGTYSGNSLPSPGELVSDVRFNLLHLSHPRGRSYSSENIGFQGWDSHSAVTLVQYLLPSLSPVEDQPETSPPPLLISVNESVNLPATPAQNLTTLEISVTSPEAGNYRESNLYYKLAAQSAWTLAGPVAPGEERIITVVADGSIYDIKALPISITDVESKEGLEIKHTVANQKGGVVLETGNYIQTSPTVGESVDGSGIRFSDALIQAFDDVGIAKITMNGNTGRLNAIDATISGTVTANAGAIGGWMIDATMIKNSAGTLQIDHANSRIRAYSGLNYVEIAPNGLFGNDSVLGSTFGIPTDGGAPWFSNGVISKTTYELQTSSVIRTAVSGQRVQINNLGVTGYDALETEVFNLHEFGLHIGGDNGSITVNSATYYNVGAGFWAGMSASGGTGGFWGGDQSTGQYLGFNPDTAQAEIGPNTELMGADAYNNRAIYERRLFSDVSVSRSVFTGGVITNGLSFIMLEADTGTSSCKVSFWVDSDLTVRAPSSWFRHRLTETKVKLTYSAANSGRKMWVYTGDRSGAGHGFGFYINQYGMVNGFTYAGGLVAYSTTSFQSISGQSIGLSADYNYDTGLVDLYSDGVNLLGSMSFNPADSISSHKFMQIDVETTGTPFGSWNAQMAEFKLLQASD